ncbi:STAS domain-containing protein [Profundibacterium mesophilum]|uniref:Sulfate transporterantisigma-factor antagonist STAS n=1 Tax=Profundibacterium mesophilum KAUST100406-0324 TaxID=1037889 RepID=A0A921TFR1_9RHOB|nr:STAS domain-containing protein [Profundibacterium mesophilum]KAF0676679.1 Sulfate transporterantisigma-factor antagonist STAS [Profundibacterium mesophilum KAUST100406-0324]
MPNSRFAEIFKIVTADRAELLSDWLETQKAAGVRRPDLFSDAELTAQLGQFLDGLTAALADASEEPGGDLRDEEWAPLRDALLDILRERSERGAGLAELMRFVQTLSNPLAARLTEEVADRPELLSGELLKINRLLNTCATYAGTHLLDERDEIIERQRDEMRELSTPVVQLWERVLTIPLIGTLDSARAQEVMENLLNAIVEHRAEVVIIDITGVRVVDTQVGQHLLRTASAVRLMGGEAIISGISPKIAQTMVELGVDVGEVTTRPTIRSALAEAFRKVGFQIVRGEASQRG